MQTHYSCRWPKAVLLLLLLLTNFLGRAWAQTADSEVSGRVVGANGSGLPGVTVLAKGTTIGTSTNTEGQYSLRVPAGATTLVFSFVGYSSQTIAIGGRQQVDVTLAEDVQALADVVVVGYGTQRRQDVVSSISSVTAREITQTPVANVAQGLQARAAGVQVTQNSAAPGGSISVKVRGTNSISGTSEPLYVIDGIQLVNYNIANQSTNVQGQTSAGAGTNDISPLSTINPNDIESVEVLKDASATAIYGTRGANGVVLITTKRGKAGQTRVSIDSYAGVQQVNKKLGVLNATQFGQLENEIYKTSVYADPAALGQGVNWQDLIFRDARIQSHQLTVAGGTEQTRVALAAGYFDQQGIILNSDFKRYSLRANLDQQVSGRIRVGTSLYGSYSRNNSVPTAPDNTDSGVITTGILGAAIAAPPTLAPYRPDGSLSPFGDQMNGRYREVVNPLGLAAVMNRTGAQRVLASIYGEADLLKGLTYRATFNADLQNNLTDYYSPRAIVAQGDLATAGAAAKINANFNNLLHESLLTYANIFAEKHSLKLTALFATQADRYNTNNITARIFPNDVTVNEAIQLGSQLTVNSFRGQTRLDSYMGRVNYNFAGKYYLDLTARVDGSSKFGKNNKYGFFPAVAVGWRLIEEPVFKSVAFLSDLKLRASYGLIGNAGAIPAYQSLSLAYTGNQYNYQLNHALVLGAAPQGIANPDLRWEKSRQTNVGLDLAVFDNRVTLTADVYKKTTTDLLFLRPLPLSSGYANYTGNFAEIDNKGLELLSDVRLLTGDVKWSVSGNISFNRNRLVSLGEPTPTGPLTEFQVNNYSSLRVGQPVGLFKGYVFDGIYQTGESVLPGSGSRVGGTKVRDLNGDGQITAADQQIIGNANPDFAYGFSTNLSYKNFDLAAFFSGVQGNDVYNLLRFSFENPLGQRNLFAGAADRWSPTNPNNEYVSGFQGGRIPFSSRFVEDGSYLRCRNLTLGYTLPTFSQFVSRARVYVSASNLFTLTDYSGFDPEVNVFSGSNTLQGVDNGVYPVARSFTGGVQVTF